MKIAVVQIYDYNIQNYAQSSVMINMLYANKHDYTYVCWNHDLVPLEYSVYYNKLFAIQSIMSSELNVDWILYLDSDAIITNDNICIEDIIARHCNKELIVARDKNGQNNGVFLIKNSPIMQQYIQDCINDSRFYHQKQPEQSAMFINLLNNQYGEKAGWEPMWFLNAYIEKYQDMQYDEPLWNEDSFILHLQRLHNEQRAEIFNQFLKTKQIYYFIK